MTIPSPKRSAPMPNGNLHETSLEIGKLVSGLSSMQAEVRALRKEMAQRMEKMEAEIKALTEFKNNGRGILLGVSMAAGGFGAAIKVAWDYLRGHGL